MKISLRPHHFICLQGYKGLNYSKPQANSWRKISKELTGNPDADIFIISGSDVLCRKCPAISSNNARCNEYSVNALDNKIAEILGIKQGQTYKYSDILAKIKQNFTSKMHEQLCSDCAWWKKGLCRDSFK